MSELDHFLRDREVTKVTGLSRSTRYEWMARGKFPKPIKLSANVAVWSARDIAEWQDEQRKRSG